MGFLRGLAAAGDGWPNMAILDLNLPGKGGRWVMGEMQADPELRFLPVAVLTNSHYERDIGGDFPHIRGTFAVKTPDLRQLVEIIQNFRQFAAEA
jgi:CheY-like chemotaxis protein